MFASLTGRLADAVLDGVDLAVEFATLGEYGVDGPIEVCERTPGAISSADPAPLPCEGRGHPLMALDCVLIP